MRYCLYLLFFTVFAQSAARAEMRDLPQVTVVAASSVAGPLTEITRIYSKYRNITVTASFDGTAEQARKIEYGESADIFISSHPFWMSVLKQKGLIDVYSLTNLVKNRLALVTSTKGSLNQLPLPAGGFAARLENLNNRTIMVMGDPDFSALGFYTKDAITSMDERDGSGLWEDIENSILRADSAKSALYLISQGETAGIVYYSDAFNNPEVNIVSIMDDSLHMPVIYQAAVVAGENMENAREFLTFLQSPEAMRIFRRYGFIVD